MSATALLLAAGKGTRMKSRLPKPLQPLLGKPMARYGVDLCRRLGISRVVVVVGHEAERVREGLGSDLEYVVQEDPNGTGHAVLAAAALLEDADVPLLVLYADNVLLTDETVAALLERQASTGAACALLTATPEGPSAYGRVIRGADGSVRAVVEVKGAPEEIVALREINAGTYVFRSRALFRALRQVGPDPTTGEIYLTDVIRYLVEAGERVETVPAEDPLAALGVNDRVELAEAAAILRRRILVRHMRSGVSVEDPATTYVEESVRIGRDTVIRPLTFLSGATVIGEECEIGPNVRITDCALGDRVVVHNAVLAESEIGEGTRIGPFAQVRPGCKIGRKVKIGNFVELKKATVEDGVSIGHLAYMGDAFIGEKSNIGAGTVTCNYDGKRKHVTRIGRRAFIGTNNTLVAPVEVGDGAYTAAASVIHEDVPPDALAIGRARQVNKAGWARKRREAEE